MPPKLQPAKMADNRYQAAAVNIAEQIAAAFQQLQEKLQQQHANFMLQMQQQHADAMLQMQQQANDMLQRHQQLPATIAQQFAPLNIAPRQLQPDQNDAIIDAAGNTTNKSEANYMHNPSNQNQLHSSTNLVNHSISAIQLPTVSKANQDDLNTIEKLDLTKVVFQTHSSLSVTAETLPDSDAKVNLLPLNKANLIGFHGSTLPTGLSLVDCTKLNTVAQHPHQMHQIFDLPRCCQTDPQLQDHENFLPDPRRLPTHASPCSGHWSAF